ncbi:MAG: hypothetical protein J1F01_05535 [Oscillospiraceae bacterium]|nr:hypothetical protein [Oscillospiraceae bacterium]
MSKQQIFTKSDGIKAVAWLSSLIASLDDKKKYVVEVKQYKHGRSLDANAYCWTLIDQLTAVMYKSLSRREPGIKKEDVKMRIYKNAIKEIGGVSEIICVQEKAVDKLIESWCCHGLGWQAEKFDSKIDGCVNVTLYYGSSVYDTAQMSRLIDSIVQECQAQGIETMTPDEIARLKATWRTEK